MQHCLHIAAKTKDTRKMSRHHERPLFKIVVAVPHWHNIEAEAREIIFIARPAELTLVAVTCNLLALDRMAAPFA